MSNRGLRRTAIAVLTVLAVGGASASTTGASGHEKHLQGDPISRVTASAAEPGIAPPDPGNTAVYLGQAGQVLDMSPSAGATSKSPKSSKVGGLHCTPISGRDNPHVSENKIDMSGHGWWKKGDCSNSRAKVFNCIYEYFTDHSWRQQACSPTKELKPGGGSSNRTVARINCRTFQQTSWRNHVEVDVIGELDTGEKPMNQAKAACRAQ
ncbi:hypothetical protein AB0I52_10020 [Streptomyces sp. NPDC050423]|uniref:hypothetical protein n=1 Tax=Streptomyces sp. NPDC050423 TaxID=3155402 RepID=UPI00341CC847